MKSALLRPTEQNARTASAFVGCLRLVPCVVSYYFVLCRARRTTLDALISPGHNRTAERVCSGSGPVLCLCLCMRSETDVKKKPNHHRASRLCAVDCVNASSIKDLRARAARSDTEFFACFWHQICACGHVCAVRQQPQRSHFALNYTTIRLRRTKCALAHKAY